MNLIPVIQDYYFSSDPTNGALDVSNIGDEFRVRFTDGALHVPREAINVEVSVPSASIWYNTPNVQITNTDGQVKNNTLIISAKHPSDALPVVYNIELPKMLVSDISQIQAIIMKQINEQALSSWAVLGPPVIFSQDAATFRIIMTLPAYATPSFVDLRATDSVSNLLGFDKQVYFNNSNIGGSPTTVVIPGARVPAFDNVNSYLIHCDMIQAGILINGISSQTVAQVPIDVEKAGFQIQFKEPIPPVTQAPHIAGSRRDVIRCWLTNERNTRVDTDGQRWSFRLRIQFLLPNTYVISKT